MMRGENNFGLAMRITCSHNTMTKKMEKKICQKTETLKKPPITSRLFEINEPAIEGSNSGIAEKNFAVR